MAEDKKPKIDLKARLGKKDPGATPAPPPTGGVPVPQGAGLPAPAAGGGLPIPPGIKVGPAPALDPSNPLAAAMAPKAEPVRHAPPQQPQRIEIDDMVVQEAVKKSRNRGFVVAAIASIIFAGVGYVGGGASQQSQDLTQSKSDAHDIKADIEKSKTQLDAIAKKVDEGKGMLTAKDPKDRKFPDKLDTDLGALIVDFDGTKLAGRRFKGMSQDVSKDLFTFVAGVAALNDHKNALKNLLTKLKKPLTDQLAASQSGTHAIAHIVLLGGPSGKDGAGNYVGNIAPLNPAISFTGDWPTIKDDYKATFQGANVGVPKYKSGNLDQPAAVYVSPTSFDAVCPADTKSQAAQLGFKLNDILTEINGEGPAPEGTVAEDKKPGLKELAERLTKGLEKI